MRNFVPCLRSRLLARAAVIVVAAGSVAACSSDSSRFGGDPYANPYEESRASSSRTAPEPESTGGITPAPSSRVERAPLSPPSAVQARPMKGFESQSSGGSYRTSSRIEPTTTGSLSPTRAAIHRPAPMTSSTGWSAEGGTTITAVAGDDAHTLSRRYGVPASAIMQANGMTSASIAEGSPVLIPSYSGPAVAARPAPARTEIAAPVAVRPAPTHVQAAAPAIVARPAPVRTEVAVVAPRASVAPKTKMTFVPGAQPVMAPKPEIKTAAKPVVEPKPIAEPKPVAIAKAEPLPAKPKPTVAPEKQVAKAEPTPPAQPGDDMRTSALKSDAAETTATSFRWPARGRVISAYGSKISGQSNDGVNIAMPEGTDVRASDDGVVAYSGSDVKGFGNIVLIRHPNGYVTAYAHNSANAVKRGDTVRRGQVIAKSGSTGDVATPQLHFEVRKGAQTIDPLKHLPG